MCSHYKDLYQAVKIKTYGENQEPKVLWAMKEAKDQCVNCYTINSDEQCGELHAVLVCASCVQSALARILTRRRAL